MKRLTLIFTLLFTVSLFAHSDHAEPGAIPPAPNGGSIGEAKHVHDKHKHDHVKASKQEVFFEGVFKGKKIKIYPLILDPIGHKTFLSQEISRFTKTNVVLRDPRKKKDYNVEVIPRDKFWEISLGEIKARRLILDITSTFDGAKYKAKVQTERK